MRSLRFITFASLAIPLLLMPPGCHRTIPSICRQTCECEPCTDADLDKCIEDTETAVGMIEGCDEQLEAYLACYDDTLSCQQGSGVGTKECDTQEQALFECSGTGNPFVTVCERATNKIATCSGSSPPDQPVTCTPDIACSSRCVLDTSCDVIANGTFSESFANCVQACSNKGGGSGGFAGGGGAGGFTGGGVEEDDGFGGGI